MKRILIALTAFMLPFAAICGATDTAQPVTPVPVNKYPFKVYFFVVGKSIKNIKKPDYGYRLLKAFPLRVKEFTFPASPADYSPQPFKAACEQVISPLPDHRKKNAVFVAREVFSYINTSITAEEAKEATAENPHALYRTAFQALKDAKACNLEKCRLATAMLRYFTIPAKTSYWKDHYVVEYYLKPLEGPGKKPSWFIMDFTGAYSEDEPRMEPVTWQPVDSKELLNEEWKGTEAFLKATGVKNKYLEENEAIALVTYDKIKEGAEIMEAGGNTCASNYYLIKETSYELMLPESEKTVEITFTMPYGEFDPFKTFKYYVRSEDKRLLVKYGRAFVHIKPPQKGTVYSLPVVFNVTGEGKQ